MCMLSSCMGMEGRKIMYLMPDWVKQFPSNFEVLCLAYEVQRFYGSFPAIAGMFGMKRSRMATIILVVLIS